MYSNNRILKYSNTRIFEYVDGEQTHTHTQRLYYYHYYHYHYCRCYYCCCCYCYCYYYYFYYYYYHVRIIIIDIVTTIIIANIKFLSSSSPRLLFVSYFNDIYSPFITILHFFSSFSSFFFHFQDGEKK